MALKEKKNIEENAQINAEIKKLENASKRSRRNFLISLGVTALFGAAFAATFLTWGGAWFAINFSLSLAVIGGAASTIITGIIDAKNRYQAKIYKSKLIKDSDVIRTKSLFGKVKERNISQQTHAKNSRKLAKLENSRRFTKNLTPAQQEWVKGSIVKPDLADEEETTLCRTPSEIFDQIKDEHDVIKDKVKSIEGKEIKHNEEANEYFKVSFGNVGEEQEYIFESNNKIESAMIHYSILNNARYASEQSFPLNICKVTGEKGQEINDYNKDKEMERFETKEKLEAYYNEKKAKYGSKMEEIFGPESKPDEKEQVK